MLTSLRVPCADLDSTMPGLLGLTAFATLLGVSALAPSSPSAARWPHRAARVATPIAARFDCVEPAAKPSFVIQSCIPSCVESCVEPTNVASVPAAAGPPIPVPSANPDSDPKPNPGPDPNPNPDPNPDPNPYPNAGLLSTNFPNEPFVVQHRSDIGYLAAQERAPVLDLSELKEITIADDGGSIKCDAGITVADVVRTLSNLKPGQQQLGGLFAVLPSNSKLPIVEAVIDAALDPESRGREYAQLSKAVEALHVVGKDGSITSKSLSDYKEDTDIVVSVILAASTPVAEPQLPSSPMQTQASCAERFLDGAFVNYADAVKSYDCARETLGCDLILGVTLSSPQRMQCKLSLSHHARTPRAHTTEDTEPLSALLLLSINYHVPPRRGQVRWPCRQ